MGIADILANHGLPLDAPTARRKPEAMITRGRKGASFSADVLAVFGSGSERPAQPWGLARPPSEWGVWGKDRLWVTLAAQGKGKNALRPLHPGARDYHAREVGGRLRGALYGPTLADCFTAEHSAFQLRHVAKGRLETLSDPFMRPACYSIGGGHANRFDRQTGERKTIDCPGARCQFFGRRDLTVPGGKDATEQQDCKVHTRLGFVLREPDLPGLYVEAHTAGGAPSDDGDGDLWAGYGSSQWWDWARQLEADWAALGLPGEPQVFGLPIALTHTVHTGAGAQGKGQEVHVADISLDLPPGQTLIGWFTRRAQELEALPAAIASTNRAFSLPALPAPPADAPERGEPEDIDAEFTP